jgi:hypothetical protein
MGEGARDAPDETDTPHRCHHDRRNRGAHTCFGGLKRDRLFMTGSQSPYSLYVNTQGAMDG